MSKIQEHFNTGDDSQVSCSGNTRLCQTFTPRATHTIVKIRLKLYRSADANDLRIRLYTTDGDGKPLLAITPIIGVDRDEITTDTQGAWLAVVDAAIGIEVEAGIRYAMVVWEATPITYYWRCKAAGDGYPRGSMGKSLDNGHNWTMDGDNVGGFMFEEYSASEFAGDIHIDQLIFQHVERMKLLT